MNVLDFGCDERSLNIPEEVLTYIFSFLDAWDRKSVRRTCSAWNEACNSKQILQTEKLRIEAERVFDQSTLVYDTLLASQLKYLNLEFNEFQFNERSLRFWKHCGSRILSLTFQQCYFESGAIFHEILVNCINLQYLDVDSTGPEQIVSNDLWISNQAFCEGFNKFKTENKKLITLKLRNCPLLNDQTYSNIVRSFPNVREILLESLSSLNFSHQADRRFYSETEQTFCSEDIFSFSCVLSHLKSNASQIKALALHKLSKGLTPYWCTKIAEIPNLKLQRLSLQGHRELTEDSLVSLLSKQTDLIEICLHKCCHKICFQTFYRLIRHCPKLEYVDFWGSFASLGYEFEDEQLLQSLLFSKKLKKVYFNFSHESGVHHLRDRNDHPRILISNKTSLYSIQENIKTYYNLTSLTLYPSTEAVSLEINDVDLQIVFHNLKHLKTFKVVVGGEVSDYGFTGVEDHENLSEVFNNGNCNWNSSIRDLADLEILDIDDRYGKSRVTNRTFNEFVFSNLKSLNLIFDQRCLDDEFVKNLSTNTPMLRHLLLRFGGNQTEFQSFLQLKQLATLKVEPASNQEVDFLSDYYRNLLSTNDLLKYCKISVCKHIGHHCFTDQYLTFARDVFTQEWQLQSMRLLP